jgi:hypothetical protein
MLQNYYDNILKPKLEAFKTQQNLDKTTYDAAVAAAASAQTSTAQASTTVSTPTGTTTQTSQTTTTTSSTVTIKDPGAAYTGYLDFSDGPYRNYYTDWHYYFNCLVNSHLKWDGLYTGVLVQNSMCWKLPPYIMPTTSTTPGSNSNVTIQSQYVYPSTEWVKSGCDCYEDAWKTYYNNIIKCKYYAQNTKSRYGDAWYGKALIDWFKNTVIPSKPTRFFVVPDNTNQDETYRPGIAIQVAGTNSRDRSLLEVNGDYNPDFSLLKAVGQDLADWTYNRSQKIDMSDYIAKAKAALEAAKEWDDTGEFSAWLKSSGFKICETLPKNPRLVWRTGTGMDSLYSTWGRDKSYDSKYDPNNGGRTPYHTPAGVMLNLDIFCSTDDIKYGRVKAEKGEFTV